MLLFFCFLLLGTFGVNGNQRTDQLPPSTPLVKVIAGSFIRPVDNVLAYSSTSPLIYQFHFDFAKMTHVPLDESDCNDTLAHCELTRHAGNLTQAIYERLQQIEKSIKLTPYDKESTRQKRNIVIDSIRDGLGSFFSFCCNLVSKTDFDSIFTTQANMKAFLTKMKNSIIGDHKNIFLLRDGFKNFTTSVQLALDHYKNQLVKLAEWIERTHQMEDGRGWTAYALYTRRLGILTVQLLQGQNKLAEFMQYMDILNHCRNHYLPFTAVDPLTLAKDIKTITDRAAKHHYEPAIDETNTMAYYNYPLAKCHFAGPEITVQLRVPLRRIGNPIKLYEVVNIPFLYEDSICSINHSPTYVAETEVGITTIQGTQLNKYLLS